MMCTVAPSLSLTDVLAPKLRLPTALRTHTFSGRLGYSYIVPYVIFYVFVDLPFTLRAAIPLALVS